MSWCGESEARLEIAIRYIRTAAGAIDPGDDGCTVVARIRAGSAQFAIML
jgi:hypothetical protein